MNIKISFSISAKKLLGFLFLFYFFYWCLLLYCYVKIMILTCLKILLRFISKPVADSFWCLAKLIQCFRFKNKIKLKKKRKRTRNKLLGFLNGLCWIYKLLWGGQAFLTILSLSIHEVFFHLFKSSLISFSDVL